MCQKIDIVIPWVDGKDINWIREKRKYQLENCKDVDDNEHRYRDWENLQYIFRGIEKYAPWVNNVYFVTWGHLPDWLNIEHPKLKVINHKDYIPKEYLPTFSANPIELNLHRIQGLEEKFIYFNDDTFLINKVSPSDFFIEDKPCDSAILNVHCYDFEKMNILTPFVDIGVINKHFSMHDVLKRERKKWFSLKYGKYLLRNIIFQMCPRFPGILQPHLPNAFLKSTYKKIWELEPELLHQTCTNKFRNKLDVNQWLIREWQLVSGTFVPRKVEMGKSMYAYDYENVCNCIMKSKDKFICINDSFMTEDEYLNAKEIINNCFIEKFPIKSSFEL